MSIAYIVYLVYFKTILNKYPVRIIPAPTIPAKIPMFLFEMSSIGAKFAITRFLIDIPGIIIIAYAIYLMIPKKEREKIYRLDAKNPDTV
jgi:hypothetical protein